MLRFDTTTDAQGRKWISHHSRMRYWTGRYESYGAFCTLRCAAEFANLAAKLMSKATIKELLQSGALRASGGKLRC